METSASSGYNPRIRELPSSERPRERLRDQGAGSLSTSELLAIILRTGSGGQNVLSLASSLLARHGGLSGLMKLSMAELKRERGLGEAKASELLALFELARRVKIEPEDRPYVRSPMDVNLLLGPEMAMLDQEHLRVVLLNTRNQVMAIAEVYKGNVGAAVIREAEVFREAIRQNAPSMILVHNHPSGDPTPSRDDIAVTQRLLEAGKILSIDVLDHIIIGQGKFASFSQLGLVFQE